MNAHETAIRSQPREARLRLPGAALDGALSIPDSAQGMVLFAHMILMDSDASAAMCLGRTYLTAEGAPEPLSRHGVEMLVR